MAIPDLNHKRVLITGAASGIGLACAHSFARQGARLIISDINPDAQEQARSALVAAGAHCEAHTCNVADETAVQRLANMAGAVDVLVNNAGIVYLGAFMDTPMAAWRRVMEINVNGVVHMTRAFLPGMREAGGARAIVNIASTAGFAPAPTMAAYAASKHAVVGLSEVLAMELAASPITVTIVAPGVISTNIFNARGNISPAIPEAQLRRLQAYYDAKGCAPAVVGDDIVRGVQSGAALVETGPFAKLACRTMRLSRRLARQLTVKNAPALGYL
ncbi:SDR family NAD(P)-dependent oxidoreductase [Duganella sp. FT3S]|uniref:SDR family NAD(P)-dependent oxidoreductase n=1 Tax=Rugamonas fusca TaxID=2758568 RepID=A0A7W2I855_9BURK|nr:SDR family NAD(P)-dependent oxidoreductase [Rugamonas fusca]MBA5607008.1 SDR family NAD(P)-dependent oxidoreductase [Rugamonas fusca]